MKKFLAIFTLIFCLQVFGATEANNSDNGFIWYQKAKHAFSNRQFSTAIDNFQKALTQGYDEAKLHYAWGAALYRIQKYDKAKMHFQKVIEAPTFTQLAYFNLGLIALKQNHNDQAISWFLKAKDGGYSLKVNILAKEMLRRINNDVTHSQRQKATIIYFLANVGYEDQGYSNSLDQVGDNDQFLELNLYTSTRMFGTDRQGSTANFNAYVLQNRYSQNTEVSVITLQGGYYIKTSQWEVSSNLGITASYLAAGPFTKTLSTDIQLQRMLNTATTFSALLGYDFVKADSAESEYATGNVKKGRIQLEHTSNQGTLYATYKYERHNRNDRLQKNNFYSYSPTRQYITIKYKRLLSKSWRSNAELRYRKSKYASANRIDGAKKLRIEIQHQSTFTVAYLVNRHATVLIGAQYTDNQSTWKRYSYQRNEFTLGIEWLFY